LGVPTMTVCTTEFSSLARQEATALGMPDLALRIISHPLGGIQVTGIHAKATGAAEDIVQRLTTEIAEPEPVE